jgi:hypothetical protein
MSIKNPSQCLIQYLDSNGISYDRSRNNMGIKDPSTFFYPLIQNNDCDMLTKLVDDFWIFCGYYRPYELILEKGSTELVTLFFSAVNMPVIHETRTLSILSSRLDDNVEIFQCFASKINFPKSYDSFETLNYERRIGVLIDITCTMIYHGNYNLFAYIVKNYGLDKNHHYVLKMLRACIFETKYYNHKILDLLMSDYGVKIKKRNITYLISQNNTTILEYIIDLIQNRKIIFLKNEIDQLIDEARNASESVFSLMKSIE